MTEPKTSPELMRAIEVLSRLPPPPKPPPKPPTGSTWTRFAAALPPDDGTPFEMRLDGQRGRYFVSWYNLFHDHPGGPYPHVTATIFGAWGDTRPTMQGVTLPMGFTIATDTPGWWRLLPADDPPPVPPDAA